MVKKNTNTSTELKIRWMQLQKDKIDKWKTRIATSVAKEFKASPERIMILPWNSKRRLTIAHKLIGERICPINQRLYHVFWNLK